MITKYAELEVLESKSSPRKVAGISLSSFDHLPAETYRTDDGYMYVKVRAISSRVNKNHDGWPAHELAGMTEAKFKELVSSLDAEEKSKTSRIFTGRKLSTRGDYGFKTFVGRPIFVDHNNSDPTRTRGVIVDSLLHVEPSSRKLAADNYWSDAPENHTPETWIELLLEIDAKSFPRLAKAFESGDIDSVSMGCNVEETECSVCGNMASDPDEYCNHIRNKGSVFFSQRHAKRVKAYEDCYGINFFEISGVFDPADETALVTGPPIVHKAAKVASDPLLIQMDDVVNLLHAALASIQIDAFSEALKELNQARATIQQELTNQEKVIWQKAIHLTKDLVPFEEDPGYRVDDQIKAGVYRAINSLIVVYSSLSGSSNHYDRKNNQERRDAIEDKWQVKKVRQPGERLQWASKVASEPDMEFVKDCAQSALESLPDPVPANTRNPEGLLVQEDSDDIGYEGYHYLIGDLEEIDSEMGTNLVALASEMSEDQDYRELRQILEGLAGQATPQNRLKWESKTAGFEEGLSKLIWNLEDLVQKGFDRIGLIRDRRQKEQLLQELTRLGLYDLENALREDRVTINDAIHHIQRKYVFEDTAAPSIGYERKFLRTPQEQKMRWRTPRDPGMGSRRANTNVISDDAMQLVMAWASDFRPQEAPSVIRLVNLYANSQPLNEEQQEYLKELFASVSGYADSVNIKQELVSAFDVGGVDEGWLGNMGIKWADNRIKVKDYPACPNCGGHDLEDTAYTDPRDARFVCNDCGFNFDDEEEEAMSDDEFMRSLDVRWGRTSVNELSQLRAQMDQITEKIAVFNDVDEITTLAHEILALPLAQKAIEKWGIENIQTMMESSFEWAQDNLAKQPPSVADHDFLNDEGIRWAKFKQSEYNGYTNWETWNVGLIYDNDYDTYQEVNRLVEGGASLEEFTQWCLENVIGPYNAERIAEAKEWNEIPQDERLDYNYEDLKDRNPQAADLVNGLGFGPDTSDDEPELIDPNQVNWKELYDHKRNDLELPPEEEEELTLPSHWSKVAEDEEPDIFDGWEPTWNQSQDQ